MNKFIFSLLVLIFMAGINYAQNNNINDSSYLKNVQYNSRYFKSDTLNIKGKISYNGDTIRTPTYVYFPGIEELMKKMTDSIMGKMDTIVTPTMIYFRPKSIAKPENKTSIQK